MLLATYAAFAEGGSFGRHHGNGSRRPGLAGLSLFYLVAIIYDITIKQINKNGHHPHKS
jgi:hypothetical protein